MTGAPKGLGTGSTQQKRKFTLGDHLPPSYLSIPSLKLLESGGVPVVHQVECVPIRPSPDRSDPGPLLNVLPSLSCTFLSISLYHKA